MEVRHKKVSVAPADEDESLVGGSDWNDEHEITGLRIVAAGSFQGGYLMSGSGFVGGLQTVDTGVWTISGPDSSNFAFPVNVDAGVRVVVSVSPDTPGAIEIRAFDSELAPMSWLPAFGLVVLAF